MTTVAMPPRHLSKSKLSMFLRTQCDRELYLSLFRGKPAEIAAAGLPAPLKSRQNVQLVTGAGDRFEKDQFQMLVTRLGKEVRHRPNFADVDLLKELPTIAGTTLCIQPAIEPEPLRKRIFDNLGVALGDQHLIPPLSGMRPDIVLVDAASPGEWQATSSGGRKRIEPGDTRQALSVIDLKNVTEGNASYAAEVCMYAVILANWLEAHGLEDKYYVSEKTYLWTTPFLTEFDALYKAQPTALKSDLIHALVRDLSREEVDFLQFMPSVKKFFTEDVPRVVRLGDSAGWQAVDYHVGNRCNACDWLGFQDWLSPADLTLFNASPDRYCVPAAKGSGHLSQIASLSRGARRVLENNGTKDVNALKALSPAAPTYSQHSFLKRNRNSLASRAGSLLANLAAAGPSVKLNTIGKGVELRASVVVTFDPSAGRLTGIGYRADYLPKWGGAGVLTHLKYTGHMVERDNDDAEWMMLSKFIDDLASSAMQAASLAEPGVASPKLPYAQIYFWEFRQYEELCKAFGRHLPRVLGLKDTKQRALAWLFPAEALLEREDGAVSPAIVFVQEVVEMAMHLPVPHVYTLLATNREYSHSSLPPLKFDSFYSEPLSNGIPRERTFEIWTNTSGVVEWGATYKQSLSDAVDRYSKHLRGMAYSLTSIVARLDQDFKASIKGKVGRLNLSGVGTSKSLAFDSQLWARWAALDHATAVTLAGAALTAPLESLEARYEAIVLDQMVSHLGGRRYRFKVSPDSLEAKIEAPNAYLTLGVESRPGFPLENGYSLGLQALDPNLDAKVLGIAMHRIVRAQLLSLDRNAGLAEVEFAPSWPGVDDLFTAAMHPSVVNIASERLYLLEGPPYDPTREIEEVLKAVGDPKNAKPDPNAILALGRAGKAVKSGTGAQTALSQILWDASSLAKTARRTPVAATTLANVAKGISSPPLNDSQYEAVKGAARAALSLIWGPPGTGKTDTLAAMVAAMVLEANQAKKPLKILLTGPNYRAVEELADRTLGVLAMQSGAACDFYRAYSKSRALPLSPKLPAHIVGANVSLRQGAPSYAQLQASLLSTQRVTLVATSAHASRKVAELADSVAVLAPVFDVAIIDESSQVPVTLALLPLATLKDESQLIIAGDTKQMPPIAALDPPVGAEYLVGSIQAYFTERFNVAELPLLTNYRSNQDIVDFALTLDYPPKLVSAQPDLRLRQLADIKTTMGGLPASLPASDAWETLLAPDKAVCTLIHEDDTASQANLHEAKMVAALVWGLFKAMSTQLDPLDAGKTHAAPTPKQLFENVVGIVTPHKAQRALILSELSSLFPLLTRDEIAGAVDTVEKFQGGQRQTIIVSFGIGDVDIIAGEEFFLLQMERINVSVSRAQAKCIVIMPKSLAFHLPTERKTLKTAKGIKSYLESFCNRRSTHIVNLVGGGTRVVEARWHE